ncbi:hypothetical protein B0H16DRAFT_1598344 [Mycena metata]|uniref:MYND-type domain-containing protein n=1 Tax=Mycena metata TaxID=1033252 RepID=A0AAD7HLJ6_9AGAR|nr:hypothetical protein B0H16DRAFT_1598344 [Mycena metata]
MPPTRRVPSAPAIALEVDRLALLQHRKKLPATFLHSFCVKERLGDLSVNLLPNRAPAIDQPFTQTLTDAEVTAVKLAADALLLFSRLAYLIDHENPALRSMMLQLWDAGVWKWMIFLYNSGVDLNDTIANDSRPLPLTRQLVTVGIVDALIGCVDSVPLSKKLVLVPDVVSLIGRLWVENMEIPGNPNMVHKELTFTIYHIVNDDTTNGSILSTLVDAVEGGAQAIMKAATDHFRRIVSSTPIDPKAIDSQILLIECFAESSVLGDALHEVETLSVAILAIDALSKQSEQNEAHAAVGSCIELFLHHLLSGTSVEPLIHAINKGLLRSIYDARVAFHSNEDCCEGLAEIIIQVVAPGLIFRSVLHAEMIKFRTTIDEDVKFCGRLACDADESDAQVKLQRCGRCQYKMYCSKVCQQEDWPKHKHNCLKESDLEITPVSDREFARARAEFEVRSDMTSLCQRVQKNPALQTREGLIFQVDFTTLDRNISIAIAPTGRADQSDRTVAIYALVQSGAKKVRSLGLVTGWEELQMSTQPGS